jgi:hypothetical protein
MSVGPIVVDLVAGLEFSGSIKDSNGLEIESFTNEPYEMRPPTYINPWGETWDETRG